MRGGDGLASGFTPRQHRGREARTRVAVAALLEDADAAAVLVGVAGPDAADDGVPVLDVAAEPDAVAVIVAVMLAGVGVGDVCVPVAVRVPVAVIVAVDVPVAESVAVAVPVADIVADRVPVALIVAVAESADGVAVCVPLAVIVGVGDVCANAPASSSASSAADFISAAGTLQAARLGGQRHDVRDAGRGPEERAFRGRATRSDTVFACRRRVRCEHRCRAVAAPAARRAARACVERYRRAVQTVHSRARAHASRAQQVANLVPSSRRRHGPFGWTGIEFKLARGVQHTPTPTATPDDDTQGTSSRRPSTAPPCTSGA